MSLWQIMLYEVFTAEELDGILDSINIAYNLPAQVLVCKFCKIFRKRFFVDHLWAIAFAESIRKASQKRRRNEETEKELSQMIIIMNSASLNLLLKNNQARHLWRRVSLTFTVLY